MKPSESLSRKDRNVSSFSFPLELSGCFCISPAIVTGWPSLISQIFLLEHPWSTSFEDLRCGPKSILIKLPNQRSSQESDFDSCIKFKWTPDWLRDVYREYAPSLHLPGYPECSLIICSLSCLLTRADWLLILEKQCHFLVIRKRIEK